MIVTIDGIPVFRAEIQGADEGMYCISLVDEPAVLRDFQKFHKQEMEDKEAKRLLYAVTDPEARLVRGVVMRSDFPIYRRDGYYEYYIVYKPETIRQMAEKYLAEKLQNNVSLDHNGVYVDGVEMVQWFIKDTAKGINPEGFEDCAEGSLFAEFHITDDTIWEAIKAGTYRGFSLEGFFELAPEEDEDDVQRIVEETQGIFRKLFKSNYMNKFNKFVNALRKVAMRTATTDKGLLAWNEDKELEVGDEVFIEDEEGNRTTAPDDIYTLTDGVKVTVEEGKVTLIDDGGNSVEEIVPEEAPAEERPEEAPEVENPDRPGEERTPEAIEALRKEMNEAYLRIEELERALAEVKERLDKVEATPAAVEAHKAVKLSAKDAKRENLARILEARRK